VKTENLIIYNKITESFLNNIAHIFYAMKYVYIDESGDLGNKYSSSKYIVFAGIMVDNPKKT